MQSMHRQFGKITSKVPGDDAKVSVLLQDFTNVDEVLTSVSLSTGQLNSMESLRSGLTCLDH